MDFNRGIYDFVGEIEHKPFIYNMLKDNDNWLFLAERQYDYYYNNSLYKAIKKGNLFEKEYFKVDLKSTYSCKNFDRLREIFGGEKVWVIIMIELSNKDFLENQQLFKEQIKILKKDRKLLDDYL